MVGTIDKYSGPFHIKPLELSAYRCVLIRHFNTLWVLYQCVGVRGNAQGSDMIRPMNEPQASTETMVRHIDIDDAHAGQRLDNFLISRLKGVPKSRIYRLLRTGQVRVNKGRCKPDYRLQPGDRVRIPPVRTGEATPLPSAGDLTWLNAAIIYEDDGMIAVNKPAGLAVHGGSGVRLGLIEALRQLRPEARFLELVHRLDRDTSGCLLLAKTRKALLGMQDELRRGGMDKVYTALMCGRWPGPEMVVDAPLQRLETSTGDRRVRVSGKGKAARTGFRVMAHYEEATLVEAELFTGRTHQIRVHAAHLAHPLAGDEKYGSSQCNEQLHLLGLKRLFLHASRLRLTNPVTGKRQQIEAPLPQDLMALLENLRHA